MVSPSVGAVVLVRFPFSDLSASKLRPAVVLANVERGDWILCQITSNAYADPLAVEIDDFDFASGSLIKTSYARPGKLFSANTSLMQRVAGELEQPKLKAVVDAVITILRTKQSIQQAAASDALSRAAEPRRWAGKNNESNRYFILNPCNLSRRVGGD